MNETSLREDAPTPVDKTSVMRASVSLILAAVVTAPGIVVTILAFSGYARTYGYVPLSDAFAVAIVAVLFCVIVLVAIRTAPAVRGEEFLLAPLLLGIGLGLYGFAQWKLSTFGLIVFTPASFFAYTVVTRATATMKSKRGSWVAISAALLTASLLLPAVLVTRNLLSTTIYLPEILRQTVIAGFLSLLHSSSMLGLAIGLRSKIRNR